jgi:hypothetical protein
MGVEEEVAEEVHQAEHRAAAIVGVQHLAEEMLDLLPIVATAVVTVKQTTEWENARGRVMSTGSFRHLSQPQDPLKPRGQDQTTSIAIFLRQYLLVTPRKVRDEVGTISWGQLNGIDSETSCHPLTTATPSLILDRHRHAIEENRLLAPRIRFEHGNAVLQHLSEQPPLSCGLLATPWKQPSSVAYETPKQRVAVWQPIQSANETNTYWAEDDG